MVIERLWISNIYIRSTPQSGALLLALRSSALSVRPVLVNATLLRVRSASGSRKRNPLLVRVLERSEQQASAQSPDRNAPFATNHLKSKF